MLVDNELFYRNKHEPTMLTALPTATGQADGSSDVSIEQRLVRLVHNEQRLVDEPGQGPAKQRADPVDPVVCPDPAGQGWPEGPCRVHGRAAEVATGEAVGTNDEAGQQRADGADLAPWVQDHGVGDEEQGEGEDHLHHQALHRADARAKGVHRGHLHFSHFRQYCKFCWCCSTSSRFQQLPFLIHDGKSDVKQLLVSSLPS